MSNVICLVYEHVSELIQFAVVVLQHYGDSHLMSPSVQVWLPGIDKKHKTNDQTIIQIKTDFNTDRQCDNGLQTKIKNQQLSAAPAV